MATTSFTTAVRSTLATAILTAIDAGTAAVIELYTATRPANADTAITDQTKLATLTCSATSGVVASGVLTFNAITAGTAVATGTATWARMLTQASGTTIMDIDVTNPNVAGQLTLTSPYITIGDTVSAKSLVITEGNA
jgi:hypothetical protein